MTSKWARWRLKSPASRGFTQPFIQGQIKENIQASHHWPLWGECTGHQWKMASNAENVSISWRHHENDKNESTHSPVVTLNQNPWWRHQWKLFPRYWPFVRGIHRSPVNSPHKGQWRGALMLSLICARINDSVNNREAGDLRRRRAHYDVTVMICSLLIFTNFAHKY